MSNGHTNTVRNTVSIRRRGVTVLRVNTHKSRLTRPPAYVPPAHSAMLQYTCICCAHSEPCHRRPLVLAAHSQRDTQAPERQMSLRGFGDWPVGQQRTSCSSRTINNEVVRAFDVRADRLDARDVYRAERRRVGVERGVQRRVGHTVRRHAESTKLLMSPACAHSPAQTTVGFFVTECIIRIEEISDITISMRVLRDGNLSVRSHTDTKWSSLVPRADRPVHSELHSTRTAGKTLWGSTCNSPTTGFGWPSLFTTGSVDLYRVDAERNVQLLSTATLIGGQMRMPLFCGDTLLVAVRNEYDYYEAVSFSIRGDRLQRDRQLITRDDRSAHRRLVVRERDTFRVRLELERSNSL